VPRLINALGGRLLQGCRDRELGFDGSQPLLREANL